MASGMATRSQLWFERSFPKKMSDRSVSKHFIKMFRADLTSDVRARILARDFLKLIDH